MGDVVLETLLVVGRVGSGIRVAANRWFPPFNDLEKLVLQSIRERVSEEFRKAYDQHIDAVNLVQRDGGNRRVRMYKWRFPGRYDWRRPSSIGPTNGIQKVARFRLASSELGEIGGSLVSIDGAICNLTFGGDVVFVKNLADVVVDVIGGTIVESKAH